jgi:hypothetical protein
MSVMIFVIQNVHAQVTDEQRNQAARQAIAAGNAIKRFGNLGG